MDCISRISLYFWYFLNNKGVYCSCNSDSLISVPQDHNGSIRVTADASVVFNSWPYKRFFSFAPLPKSLSPSSLILWGITSKRTTL